MVTVITDYLHLGHLSTASSLNPSFELVLRALTGTE
jgi:hypothetical protein